MVKCFSKSLLLNVLLWPFMPKKSWEGKYVKFDKKLSVKQRSESLVFLTRYFNHKLAFFSNCEKHFSVFYQSQK